MKKNNKKLITLILIITISFFAFIYIYHKKRNYKVSYFVNGYSVFESFDIDSDHYYLNISKDAENFEIYLPISYSPKRKIVTSIESEKTDTKSCIKLNDNIVSYPICKQSDEYISYYSETEIPTEKKDTYNNIDIYNLLENTYLIWNYKGFYYISNDKISSINLFKTDTYTPYLLTILKNYLFIINYDEQYNFDSYYLVDSKKGTSKKYKISKEISKDSYILGTYKNSVYIIDKKNEQEYELNAKKGKVYKTSGKVLVNNEWQKKDIDELIKSEQTFKNEKKFYYEIAGKKLYLIQENLKTKLTNLDVDYIIDYDDNNVYFVSNGTLYRFKIDEGITKIMQYSEWNFNYKNCIFIFNNQN